MKAIVLFSGGLDSILSIRLVQNLGIDLICLNIVNPFSHFRRKDAVTLAAKEAGLRLISINATDEFLGIVNKPKHGYGSNMNPCIDCRILLFRKAKETMLKEGAAFVVTGEVLGQRPMSQMLNTMKHIDEEADLSGLVLRPLSAKLLEPTIPEKEGWIARDNLLKIAGRGRREQIFLAKKLGISDYPWPSGGCLLTDPEFSRRIKDLIKYRGFNIEEIQLLKSGRHFRLSETAKLIVGRNKEENGHLFDLAKRGDYLFSPGDELPGPVALGRGIFNDNLIAISSSIVCRYCDLKHRSEADIICAKVVKKQATSPQPIGLKADCRTENNLYPSFTIETLRGFFDSSKDESSILKVPPLEESKLVNLRI